MSIYMLYIDITSIILHCVAIAACSLFAHVQIPVYNLDTIANSLFLDFKLQTKQHTYVRTAHLISNFFKTSIIIISSYKPAYVLSNDLIGILHYNKEPAYIHHILTTAHLVVAS
jgi:hypothetical protein